MGKGSRQRPRGLVTDQNLLDNWERIFNSKPTTDQVVKQQKANLKEKDKDGNT